MRSPSRRAPPILAALLAISQGGIAVGCATGGAPPVAAPPGVAGLGPESTAVPEQAPKRTAPILAGAAARRITPEVVEGGSPVRMGGFGSGRDATGVHDDLEARAMVLESDGRSVALVALDLIGLFHDDVERIRQELHARYPEARVGSVLVASTHTHAGPDVIGLWTPPDRSVDAAYVARLRSQAVEAIADAWKRRRQARLSFASARLPDLIDDSRLPRVIDDLALLMKVDAVQPGASGGTETIATLVSFPDHPESLGRDNSLISSDYPGAIRRSLEASFGGVSLFFSADIGGLLTPLDAEVIDPDNGRPVPKGTYRKTELLGQTIAGALAAAWRAGPGSAGGTGELITEAALEVRAREFRVPLLNPRFLRGLESGHIWPRELDESGTLRSEAAVLSIRTFATGLAPDGTAAAVAGSGPAVRAQFACVPGEIYPELVIGGIQDPQDPGADLQGAPREAALRPMMSGRERFILGLCDDELGYIIPMSEWDEKPPFAYGRTGPQYGEGNSTGPRTAPILLDLFADLLR